MTRDDIIRMAREAGIRDCTCNAALGCLKRFAALVAAAEREARKKMRDDIEKKFDGQDFLAAIRARE
jgi:hypothetical protein